MGRLTDIANDYSAVINVRDNIYKTKKEIIRSQLVKDLVAITFDQPFIPRHIQINATGIFSKVYDAETKTYHPIGLHIYTPDVLFDYVFCAALASIFQDIYPDVYNMNKYNTTEFAQAIQNGTWHVDLELKEELLYKEAKPAFDFSVIDSISLDSNIIKTSDDYTKQSSKMGKISITIGIVAFVSFFFSNMLNIFLGFVGIITGIIAVQTNPKGSRKQGVIGIILSALAIILPIVIALIIANLQFNSWLNG